MKLIIEINNIEEAKQWLCDPLIRSNELFVKQLIEYIELSLG